MFGFRYENGTPNRINYDTEDIWDGFNENSEYDRLMQGVNIWCGYYRANPHKFVADYLDIQLKLFQQILIYFMNIFHYFMFIASRGLGKTYLTAIFCCVRCILYPETKIIIASGQRTQAIEVITKIVNELMPKSPNLKYEIEKYILNTQDSSIMFKNGSWISVVTANDGARSKRSNIIIVDEFRLVPQEIVSNVLRKFNIAPRQPRYLSKPEYAHLQERNKEIYLTSAWLKSEWSWQHLLAYAKSMLAGKQYFLCGLPYQLAIKEGLLMREQVEDEMQEKTFNPVNFDMEMGCVWQGGVKDAFFDFNEISLRRNISTPIYPSRMCSMLGLKKIGKQDGEIRILSVDIALMGGKKNDATAMFFMQLLPNSSSQYIRNIVYVETLEGGHSSLQAIRIKQLYQDFNIDYIVIDGVGNGMAVTDQLQQIQTDQKNNAVYPALNVFNRDDMASRCQVENAPKVIYVVKADESMNSHCAVILKDAIRRGNINLLYHEIQGKESLYDIPKYKQLEREEQLFLLDPYIQTTLLIQEMILLSYSNDKGRIKVYEKGTNRKDRYSALAYANYYANELEIELRNKDDEDINWNTVQFYATSVNFR